MGKNKILKILLLFAIILFGLGKIYLSRNNSINAKENFSKEFIAQNKKNGKKNAVKQKNIENKNGKRTQNTSNQGNRKYQIDYDHVIGGDENSQGKVTGGHSLLRGDVRIVKKIGNPAKNGVYRASIEVKKKDGTWQAKTSNGGVNTMFPENWDEARIIDEINSAWENRKDVKGRDNNMWQGISKSGVVIRGYKSPRITAYPVYENR
ncbi:EndoU domain-containing protein [Leptotrichia massiliensis]|jgi:mafB1|uniref:EndoU domain-containing protein n=1 Tax=Leptotrichia massiliensis TaxID=1852388 RepID=UPI0008D93CCE|nr:EndoU domain-containing protein [Leptotrichia massiliensis]